MMYIEAFHEAHTLVPFRDCEKWPCTCPQCYGIELTPLHVDDRSGVHFLRCPICGSIYMRPAWYETPEEKLIGSLLAKIAELEARITALEHRPATMQRQAPRRQYDVIELPELLTVS